MDEGGWSTPSPGCLTPGKVSPNPLYKSWVGTRRVRKISPPPRFDPRTTQPVTNRYIDCAIAIHKLLPCSIGTWGRDNRPRAEMQNSWLLWYRKISNSSERDAQTTLWFLEGSRNSATLQSTTAPSLRVYRLPNARPRAKSAAAHCTIFRCSSWLVQQLVHVFYCCCDVAPTSASIWHRVRRLSFPFLIARLGLTLPEGWGQ